MGSVQEPGSVVDDIAVVGLACRFPGGASNSAKFWDLLADRKSAHSEAPPSRYNASGFHHLADKLNTLSCRGGHFLDGDVAAFDAPFFNITAQEAKAMDPTARMLLEVTYEAFENAGIPVENLTGSQTSCYVGCFTRDYHEMLMRDAETSPMYAGTGTGFSLLSNRVSWFYDLRGPSMTLDTACSSSLVGLHLACQGLRTGESKVAVVSGANLILSPDLAMWLSNLHMTSKDGLSRSFADGTTGYGRGEGIATLILKPLTDALHDGDAIRAVIRGTGVNQDGHTTGITVPNSLAQADLIRSTYRSAGLDFSQTGYFEAHGTGTAVGDPLELAAVAKTLAEVREPGDNLFVGSVKSNIGHLEGAAGLAGAIKCILMLENGIILPNIHFDKPNKRIPFESWKIQVPTTLMPWPSNCLRRASVNSFGYGGTNAHAILDSADEYLLSRDFNLDHHSSIPEDDLTKVFSHKKLFVFGARDEAALDRMRVEYINHLERIESMLGNQTKREENFYLDRMSFSLGHRRSRFDWKAHVTASSITELKKVLSMSKFGAIRSTSEPRIAFIFTGQGAQWARMGIELLKYSVFNSSVADAEAYLRALGCEWSVIEELEKAEHSSSIQFAKISQPVCTILQVALIDLLLSWNIKPSAVVGHSSGEIGAAYCYGAITRETAWKISYWRGKLCSGLRSEAPELKGAMMAVGLSAEAAQKYILKLQQGKVVVACVNSPSSVTISGDDAAIDELLKVLKVDSIFCRKLKVENAYHSQHMELIAQRYLDCIADIQIMEPTSSAKTMRMASSVTGNLITHAELGPAYWVRNLVSPVLFSNAVQTLSTNTAQRSRRRAKAGESSLDFLLEVGPHAALKGPLRQILQAQAITNFAYGSMILRGEDASSTAVRVVGILHCHGTHVKISEVNMLTKLPRPLTDLPPYPWNHSLTYWSESRISQNYRSREHGRHDLLGSQALGSDDIDPKWRHFLKVSENPWIQDHVVHSSILYPGAGIIAMPIEAMRQIADKDKEIESIQLRDVRINKAIVINDMQDGIETFLQLRRQFTGPNRTWNGWWEFSVNTRIGDQEPQQNGSGLVSIRYKVNSELQWVTGKNIEFEALKQEFSDTVEICTRYIEPEEFYKATAKAGLQYGPLFQGLTELHAGKGYCRCVISIPNTKAKMPEQVESSHLIHPTTLDIIFHSLFAALGEEGMDFTNAAVPIAFESLVISGDLPSGANSKFSGFCHTTRSGSREVVADICMSDMAWNEPKIQIKGIRCRELPGIASSIPPTKAPCGTLLWKPDIDHLDGHLLRCYLEKGLGCISNKNFIVSEEEIYKVIELAAFKNPELSVLQIGQAASKFTSSILSVIGARSDSSQRFSKYTLADKDSQEVSKAEGDVRNEKTDITYKLLDQTLQLEASQYADNSFDIVVISLEIDTAIVQQQLISSIERVLKSGGYVLALQLHNDLIWSKPLSHSGFIPLISQISAGDDDVEKRPSKSGSWYIARNPKADPVEELPKQIFILTPQDSSDRITAVANEIVELSSRRGLHAKTISWPPEVPVVLSHSVISLLELEETFLSDISSQDFIILKTLLLETSSMLWVTKGEDPIMNTAVGYLRSVKNENPNLNTRYLRLEDTVGRPASSFADTIMKIVITPSIEREYIEIEGCLNINRWVTDEGMSRMLVGQEAFDSHEYMAIGESYEGLDLVLGNPKQPSSFYFDTKLDSADELRPTEVEIEVKAIGLNAQDLEISDQDHDLSCKEFSGFVVRVGKKCARVQPGDRVCALTTSPYSTILRVEEALCNQIPLQLTFEDASCWPITFGTAYQSLVRVAKLQAGKTILIQAAASAPGQASVQLAKSLGAIVHATVSSEEECRIVESWGIPRSRIFSDTSEELSADLKRFTQGKGFDVILNFSRIGERFCDLWLLTAPFGVFIDANKLVSSNDAALDIAPFRRGSTFSVVNLEVFLQTDFSLLTDILERATSSMTKYKIHSVTSKTVFPANTIGMGFEYLQNHGNVGKTIISFNNRQQVPISPNARKRINLDKKYTYIIAGGLGGLGQSLAQLLVEIGAKHIVFLSRSGAKSKDSQKLMESLAASHVLAKSYACDISDEQAMRDVLQRCSEEMPPIKGVIQSAAVLNDSVYENMTHDMWQAAIRPKIQGTKLLHDLLPKNMDFFVMLSSISGVVGNRSQANYAAGNTFQDELAQYRRRQGLPAVSIDLGLMLDIGLIAQRGGSTNLKKSEAVGLYESDFHAIVKAAIVGSYGLSETPGQLITGLPTGGILQMEGLEEPFYYDDPRFSILRKTGLNLVDAEIGEIGASSGAIDAISQLTQCSSLQEAARLISTALCVRLAKALETVPDNIDSGKPLHTYGVDSLMAVDFRTWIISQIKAEISLFDILSGGSIETLASKIATTSKLVPVGIDRRGSLDERRGSLSKS